MALALSSSNPPLFPLNRIWKEQGQKGEEGGRGAAALTEIEVGLVDRRTGCI